MDRFSNVLLFNMCMIIDDKEETGLTVKNLNEAFAIWNSESSDELTVL